MRIDALRLSMPSFFLTTLVSISSAGLDYRIKHENVEMFRSQTLEPPPLAILGAGTGLYLLSKGLNQSLVETEMGIKGWVNNRDVIGIATAPGGEHAIGNQKIISGGEFPGTIDTYIPPTNISEIIELNRSFTNDIIEPMDREQLEMQFDEN